MFSVLKNQRGLHTPFSNLQKKLKVEIVRIFYYWTDYTSTHWSEDKTLDSRKIKSELHSSLLQFVVH